MAFGKAAIRLFHAEEIVEPTVHRLADAGFILLKHITGFLGGSGQDQHKGKNGEKAFHLAGLPLARAPK
jgi:hypothetical protein